MHVCIIIGGKEYRFRKRDLVILQQLFEFSLFNSVSLSGLLSFGLFLGKYQSWSSSSPGVEWYLPCLPAHCMQKNLLQELRKHKLIAVTYLSETLKHIYSPTNSGLNYLSNSC